MSSKSAYNLDTRSQKRFASPDIVVVPTVKPRKPRQASNRIRVGRHGMRIKVWILLGNVQFDKTEIKI